MIWCMETGIRTSEDHPYVIIWLDDASRMALAGGRGIRTYKQLTWNRSSRAIQRCAEQSPGGQYLDTRGEYRRDSRFCSNKNSGSSAFEHDLQGEGIRHVPSRQEREPQTNGKLERLWLEYDRHRGRFESSRSKHFYRGIRTE
jgi:hypothetical protein